MNEYTLESFIDFCDDYQTKDIATEGIKELGKSAWKALMGALKRLMGMIRNLLNKLRGNKKCIVNTHEWSKVLNADREISKGYTDWNRVDEFNQKAEELIHNINISELKNTKDKSNHEVISPNEITSKCNKLYNDMNHYLQEIEKLCENVEERYDENNNEVYTEYSGIKDYNKFVKVHSLCDVSRNLYNLYTHVSVIFNN